MIFVYLYINVYIYSCTHETQKNETILKKNLKDKRDCALIFPAKVLRVFRNTPKHTVFSAALTTKTVEFWHTSKIREWQHPLHNKNLLICK